jgi:murein tripeptide amidase MpaA
VLCKSLGGLPIPLLTITESEKNEEKSLKKKFILICARVHPGESNSSFMMEGFLKFICGDSFIAHNLRKYNIFKIVPMMNPDGVAIGNYRTGLSGKDFNR